MNQALHDSAVCGEAAMSPGDLAAYVEAVRTLWPEGPDPKLARRGASSTGRPGWLVAPHPERPRMLVPDHPAAASAAMWRFSSALGPEERIKRVALGAGLRATRGRVHRGRLEAGSVDGSLLQDLSASAGTDLLCSLTLGTARANRKPVLQLFDDRGKAVAFAKVGSTERAMGDVRTEHRNLLALAEARLPERFEIPRALALHEWRGLPTLVMTELRTPLLERRLVESAELLEAMDGFARTFDAGTVPLPDVPLWATLTDGLDDVADAETRNELETAMKRLGDQAADTTVTVGAWHGDWAPWNMSRSRGRIQLWDWERFATGVPVGFDRCHFGINTALATDGVTPAAVRRGIGLGGFTGPRPGSADHAVVGLYLVAILHRYLAGDDEVPAQVQARVTVLREVLASWVGR